ncbi:CHASE domain-containing protein [Pseudoalteromonas tunicata]|uniref:CHASE domain-containing protein n=1 Tax=Pseudoalteromonas tunicata TaxID=314281 RepID=UPI00274024EE|nr:CHASE domain-containing protein [Pseudoalteromonas tunicata]MDP4985520.1 CHASE domain-containing protein [Pseudoalteromonas tunicata]
MQSISPKSSQLKKSILHSLWLPLVALVMGLSLAIHFNQVAVKEEQSVIQNALNERLSHITENVKDSVTLYGYALQSLRSNISTIGLDNFNYQKMQIYIQSHSYNDDYPEPRGLGLIRLVKPQDQTAFIEMAKAERPDNTFNIRQLAPHNNDLFIIQYIEPESRNKQAVGLDIGSEAMRRNAALNAAEYDSPRLTGPITLVQANQKTQQGFLILSPVFNSLTPPTTSKQRVANVVAWSYSPILIDEVLSDVSSLKADIILSISDQTTQSPQQFYTFGDMAFALNDHRSVHTIDLLGRQWQLTLTATPEFLNELNLAPPYQAFGAVMTITFTIMLALFSGQLILMRQSQMKAYELELAQAREKALTEANLKLEEQVEQRASEIANINLLQKRILEASSYAIITTDIKGIITLINPAGEKMLGYSVNELVGKLNPGIFHLPDEIMTRAQALSDELGTQIEPGFEVFVAKARIGQQDINRWTYVHKEGKQFQVKLSINSLYNEFNELVGFLGIASDLTEQLKREQALAHAKDRAEKAVKVKSEFLANMSHEIRTPMNGLFGVMQLLKQENLSSDGKNLLDKALYSAKNLTVIINDILDFSKIEAGKLTLELTNFKLSELIEHINSDLSVNAFNKQIDLTFEINVKHDFWFGDPIRIRQILLNIISNAIKFTNTGGVKVLVNALPTSNGLQISVIDTGIGIAPDAIERLFNRFEQADKSTTRKYGGTGLGLSISQSLIDLMQGEISVTSEENKGTSFSIMIPLVQAHVQQNTPPHVITQLNLDHKTILIAEDNAINIIIVTAMLKPTNATLIIANNGLEAIELTQQHQPDLILMDIQMPEMDGITACQHIKAFDPFIPIVALTANAFAEDKILYAKVGFNGYLAKPLDSDQLMSVIHKALNAKMTL